MNTLDTRNLHETRELLKEEIYESFIENFPDYECSIDSYEDIDILDEDFETNEEIENWLNSMTR